MIGLDALEHPDRAPEVWMVLTTRTPTLDMRRFYKARELTVRALRRRWDGVSYASVLEYTTGYGPRAGGERRPHWNLLVKGLTDAEIHEVEPIVRRVWCSHVDARPAQQYVGPVWEVGGLAGYLAAHVHKENQKPPPGFRGQRFNCARDYFEGTTRAQMRERARESVQWKALLWRAQEPETEGGPPRWQLAGAESAEAFAHELLEISRTIDWRLIRMGPGWREEVPPRIPRSEIGSKQARAAAWETEAQVAAALRARDEHDQETPP